MVIKTYHGSGPGGFAEKEGRVRKFSGALEPGRHLFTTTDINVAYLYGRHVWELTIDVYKSEILDIGDCDVPYHPFEWVGMLGLTLAGIEKMPDHFVEFLENYPRCRMTYAEIVGKHGDGREYSAANEKKLFAAIRESRPDIEVLTFVEKFHDVGFGVLEYRVYVVLDQSIVASAEKVM